MRKDPTAFRERFKKWKETGEYELPRFKGGKEGKRYIGGTTAQARDTYWSQDPELFSMVDSVANAYGINPDLLRNRLDHEGFVDARINEINKDYKKNTNLAMHGRQLFNADVTPSDATDLFGLDDGGTYLHTGFAKLINEDWGDGDFENEKGRRTLAASGYTYGHNIGITAAILKAMRLKAKEDFPNASDAELDRHAAAYYNRGVDGGKRYVKSGAKDIRYNILKRRRPLKPISLNRPESYKVTTDWDSLPKFTTGTENVDIEERIKRSLEQRSDNTTVQRQEPVQPIKRSIRKSVVPLSWVEKKQKEQPAVLLGKNYTQRRVLEELQRKTWRSDVADELHGAGEGALFASNFIPFGGELFAGGRALFNNAKSYLLHPFYKTVYHGSPIPFNIKNAWTATSNDLGLHVTPNKLTSIEAARAGTDKPGFVYKLRIPKEDAQTIDIGNNGVGHLYQDLFMDARINKNPAGIEPSTFYDTTPGDIYRFNILKEAGANPSLTDATHLQTQNPVYINLRKQFSKLTPRQHRIADRLVDRHKQLMSEGGYVPGRNNIKKEINQEANDLLRSAGYRVIKYHNANPYEGGGGTAYMVTDPSVIDVIQNVPKEFYAPFVGSFSGYGTNKLIQRMNSE